MGWLVILEEQQLVQRQGDPDAVMPCFLMMGGQGSVVSCENSWCSCFIYLNFFNVFKYRLYFEHIELHFPSRFFSFVLFNDSKVLYLLKVEKESRSA